MNISIILLIIGLYCHHIASETIEAETTFYGAKDNCPPGGDIAYPQIHKVAGGNGTYNNPITYAGSKLATEPGTIIYVQFLQKYFVMEDDCQECDEDWITRKKWHFDLWMGPDVVTNGSKLISCEDTLTKSRTDVIIDPDPTLTVNMKPLFNGDTLECWQPSTPCITKNPLECGNECEIPQSGTCTSIAAELLLTLQRFKELNPTIDCNREIAAGTTVCMGGPCGD